MERSFAVGTHHVVAIPTSAAPTAIAHKLKRMGRDGGAHILYRREPYVKIAFLVWSLGHLYHHSAQLHNFPIVEHKDLPIAV